MYKSVLQRGGAKKGVFNIYPSMAKYTTIL